MHLRNSIVNAFRRKVLLGGNMHQDYRRLVAFAGALALLVVLIPTPATAQNRIIKGKVINEHGDPLRSLSRRRPSTRLSARLCREHSPQYKSRLGDPVHSETGVGSQAGLRALQGRSGTD